MNRADIIGDRILKMQGGQLDAVYLVETVMLYGDKDRGVRGTPTTTETELKPRPILRPVTVERITRANSVLRAGDFQVRLSGSQISIKQLTSDSISLRTGTIEMKIVGYDDARFVQGDLSSAVVYLRGVKD